MTDQPQREDVMDAFAMEREHTPVLLKDYIERYPMYAIDLADFYHELAMSDVEQQTPTTDVIAQTPTSAQIGLSVSNALTGERLQEHARTLGLPRDFLVGFRDARIRLGSIPGSLLSALAKTLDVRLQDFVAHFQHHGHSNAAMAFKAEQKPGQPDRLEFDAFVNALELNESEQRALGALTTPHEPD